MGARARCLGANLRVSGPGVRVVVPLHDGASTIAALVDDLAVQRGVTISLAVVANGCSDDSAAVARRALDAHPGSFSSASVLDVDRAGRTGALLAGEALVGVQGPLVVCDQDVRVPPAALAVMHAALHPAGAADLVTPLLRMPGGLAGLPLRYWRTWARLPYVDWAPVSVGLYAVSEQGRAAIGPWPAAAPDDKHARGAIGAERCARLGDTWYTVDLPASVRAVVVARAGYVRANRRLRHASPAVAAATGPRHAGTLRALAGGSWLDAAVFLTLYGTGVLLDAARRARSARPGNADRRSAG